MQDQEYDDSSKVSSELFVNSLVYKCPDALSLATSRTYTREFFQKNFYGPLDTARIDVSSGSSYVDPENSYLTFRVKLTTSDLVGGDTANFGTGSAMNLISDVLIRSKSGTELCRVMNANQWSRITTLYSESEKFLSTKGLTEGWAPTISPTTTDVVVSSDVWWRFTLPLKRLAPFFAPVGKTLLPASLVSGMSMEITWADFRTAIKDCDTSPAASTITGYEIKDISLVFDAVTLTDDTQKTLNLESSKNGLDFVTDSVYVSINDQPSLSTNLSAQVRKAVSQAKGAFTVVQSSANKYNLKADSFASMPWDTLVGQYRLGSLYIPQQPLSDPTRDGVETYTQLQSYWDVNKHSHMENYVSLTKFQQWAAIAAVSLERNQALELSSLPINSSRVLEYLAEFESSALQRSVSVFLIYTQVAKAFIDNVAVTI